LLSALMASGTITVVVADIGIPSSIAV